MVFFCPGLVLQSNFALRHELLCFPPARQCRCIPSARSAGVCLTVRLQYLVSYLLSFQ
nr:MAG TPA: hypothetical protein [Caudoviricetes sp.]